MIHPKLSFHGISIHRFVPSFFILKLYELSIFIFGILGMSYIYWRFLLSITFWDRLSLLLRFIDVCKQLNCTNMSWWRHNTKFKSKMATFSEADSFCKNKIIGNVQMKLLSFTSIFDTTMFHTVSKRILDAQNITYLWTSATLASSREFVYSDGTPISDSTYCLPADQLTGTNILFSNMCLVTYTTQSHVRAGCYA